MMNENGTGLRSHRPVRLYAYQTSFTSASSSVGAISNMRATSQSRSMVIGIFPVSSLLYAFCDISKWAAMYYWEYSFFLRKCRIRTTTCCVHLSFLPSIPTQNWLIGCWIVPGVTVRIESNRALIQVSDSYIIILTGKQLLRIAAAVIFRDFPVTRVW